MLNEANGAGYSLQGGTMRGIGVGSRLGGGASLQTMYTIQFKPLNHTLETPPTTQPPEEDTIRMGSIIRGKTIRSTATPEGNNIIGLVQNIVKTERGVIKYYVVQDRDTQKQEKIDPVSARLLKYDPVERAYHTLAPIPGKRKVKTIHENLVPESLGNYLKIRKKLSESLGHSQ